MIQQTISLFGKEFLIFSNIPVDSDIIHEMIDFAKSSRLKYFRRCLKFCLTRNPISWQIEEMLLFTIQNCFKFAGLSLGIFVLEEWQEFGKKLKEAYHDGSYDTEDAGESSAAHRATDAYAAVYGSETSDRLLS